MWDLIRDWFVTYIWGGTTSTGLAVQGGRFGVFMVENGDSYYTMAKYNNDSWFKVGSHYINFGDWASTTSTIIVLIGLCVFFYIIIRYLFRLTSGLIRGH